MFLPNQHLPLISILTVNSNRISLLHSTQSLSTSGYESLGSLFLHAECLQDILKKWFAKMDHQISLSLCQQSPAAPYPYQGTPSRLMTTRMGATDYTFKTEG